MNADRSMRIGQESCDFAGKSGYWSPSETAGLREVAPPRDPPEDSGKCSLCPSEDWLNV